MLDHILTKLNMVNSLTKLLTKGKFDKLGENLGLLEKKKFLKNVRLPGNKQQYLQNCYI